MSTHAGCSHSYEALSRVDPTGTKTLRNRYGQRLRGGYARINTVIREYVTERDIFGLRNEALVTPPSNFEFTTDDRKVEAFESWLQSAQEDEVLNIIDRDNNRFVERAYTKGVEDADRRLSQAGVAVPDEVAAAQVVRAPTHSRKIQLIYTRNYRELTGITRAVDQQVSRELAQGLSEGRNPVDMARSITDRVDKIGKTRATTLARTEVINAHAEATLTRYEQQGIEDVEGRAEFLTAGDSRVCSQCASLEGNVYTLDEARGLVPQHPNCRCTWIPVVN